MDRELHSAVFEDRDDKINPEFEDISFSVQMPCDVEQARSGHRYCHGQWVCAQLYRTPAGNRFLIHRSDFLPMTDWRNIEAAQRPPEHGFCVVANPTQWQIGGFRTLSQARAFVRIIGTYDWDWSRKSPDDVGCRDFDNELIAVRHQVLEGRFGKRFSCSEVEGALELLTIDEARNLEIDIVEARTVEALNKLAVRVMLAPAANIIHLRELYLATQKRLEGKAFA